MHVGGLGSPNIFIANYDHRRHGTSPDAVDCVQGKSKILGSFTRFYAKATLDFVDYLGRASDVTRSPSTDLDDYLSCGFKEKAL